MELDLTKQEIRLLYDLLLKYCEDEALSLKDEFAEFHIKLAQKLEKALKDQV